MKHGKHHGHHGHHSHHEGHHKRHHADGHSSYGKKSDHADFERDSGVSHEREKVSFNKDISASAGKLWNRYEHQGGKDIHKCRPSGKMS